MWTDSGTNHQLRSKYKLIKRLFHQTAGRKFICRNDAKTVMNQRLLKCITKLNTVTTVHSQGLYRYQFFFLVVFVL